MNHLLAILGLGLLCAAWFLVQHWVKRHDPDQPGVENHQHCGGHGTCHCERRASHQTDTLD